MADHQVKIVEPNTGEPTGEPAISIPKLSGFNLDKFKSKHADAIANVETLLTGLPHYRIAEAKDFVRLHPNQETYWSPELCSVSVPIEGAKNDVLHLIEEELAMRFLPSARILRFRLALATKPFDKFFLAHIPTRNLDNAYNATAVQACELAQTHWVMVTSRKAEGIENYKIDYARDQDPEKKAFPDPKWPKHTLEALIGATFLQITDENHPALLRLIGGKVLDE
jgi:hypothetical protein